MLAAPLAGAAIPTFKGASADGEIVFFQTEESLVPGDTDSKVDVYRRSFDASVGEGGAYVTREVSTGPTGGNDAHNALFETASSDGAFVFFSTDERLTGEDTDRRSDVYMRETATGTTTIVTVGAASCAPGCGNATVDAAFAAAAADGSKVYFVSDERLEGGDTDNARDVYVRDVLAETTALVSVGAATCAPACGNGDFDTFLRGLSSDGTVAFFTSAEPLSSVDLDTAIDVYVHDLEGPATTLVSQGGACAPICGNGDGVPVFRGSSDDGGRAFFTTDEALVQTDEDEATDVYARDLPGGPTVLVSDGEAEELTASFEAASGDGSVVFFSTTEALDPADVNGAADVYTWSGGAPDLLTSGTCTQGSGCGSNFNAATSEGEVVVFTTTEALVGGDEDSGADVYAQQVGGGAPELVSRGEAACQPGCGNGGQAAIFGGISADAARVFFTTAESLAAEDADTNADVYLRDLVAAETTLASPPGFCPVPAKQGGCDVVFSGVSSDADHLFFQTPERLGLEDGDSEADIYERAFGGPGGDVTRLVSTGNSADLELGPSTPVLEDTDPVSPAASTTPALLGTSDTGTTIKVYTQAGCTGEVKATGTAAELSGAGIEVEVPTETTTSFWITATDVHGDTSACSNALPYTHESPSDPGGGEGEGGSEGGGGSKEGSVETEVVSDGGPRHFTPHTRITFAPASKTRLRNPVFRFVDATGQEGTRFRCKIDRRAWRGCGSPVRVKKLGRGRHVFAVKGVNALGEWEPAPAKRSFKVVPR